MNDGEHAGKRAIAHSRVSTGPQVEFSLDRQLEQMQEFAKLKGIEIVDVERLEAVSGLDAMGPEDIDRLLTRKINKNDFDVLLLSDVDRLTRSGVPHGFHIWHMLETAGIEIIFARLDIPSGAYGWVPFAFKCAEANSDIKGITKRLNEGWQKARDGGRVTHTSRIPYGCDKLVSTAQGIPLYRVRRKSKDSYQIMSPDGTETIRTIVRSSEESSLKFKTQQSDLLEFVPGDPEEVRVVQMVFKMHYVDGINPPTITRYLNAQKIERVTGPGRWHCSQVYNMLLNPLWFGCGLTNQSTGAKLQMRGKGVTGLTPPRQRLFGKKKQKLTRPASQWRSPDDWVPMNYPSMASMLGLPPDVVEKARKQQLLRRARRAERQRAAKEVPLNRAGRKSGGSRHEGSDFFLTTIIKCAVDGMSYTGKQTRTYRYYSHADRNVRLDPSRPIISVPAGMIEDEVLRCIRSSVKAMPDLEGVIVESINAAKERRQPISADGIKRLEQKEQSLLKQIDVATRVHCDLKANHLNAIVDPLKAELRNLTVQIEEAKRRKALAKEDEVNVPALARRVAARLSNLLGKRTLFDAPKFVRLRAIARVMIKKLTVHPETRAVELEIGLPSWFIKNPEMAGDPVSLENTSRSSRSHEDNSDWIMLGRFLGVFVRTKAAKHRPHHRGLTLDRVA